MSDKKKLNNYPNEDDLLNFNDIGTLKRSNQTMKKEPQENPVKKTTKPNLMRDLQKLVNWIDGNVLPTVFLILLAGFAVLGVAKFLPDMTETARKVVSVVAVIVMVVKAKADRV